MCPPSVIWGDVNVSCHKYCIEQGYIGGALKASRRRCRCHKYEEECKSNSVDNWSGGSVDILLCYYDVCFLMGT